MKYIEKGREPESLKHYRSTPGAYYDDYHDKNGLLQALMEEQGFICCYCMQRIPAESGKAHIEHWKPQSLYPDLQLEYKNLFAVCDGNKGNPEHLQHCDQSKRNNEISINPTNPSCETLVKFGTSGDVYSDSEKIDQELDKVLKLNQQVLIDYRKIALDKAWEDLKKAKEDGVWSKAFLEEQIRKWESLGTDGKYKPYCRVVIYNLEKELSRYS